MCEISKCTTLIKHLTFSRYRYDCRELKTKNCTGFDGGLGAPTVVNVSKRNYSIAQTLYKKLFFFYFKRA